MDIQGLCLPGIKHVLSPQGQAVTGTDGLLKPGQTVQARVVAASTESVVLNIGGARITATTDVPLNAGQVISLMIAEITPGKVVFRHIKEQERGSLPAKYSKDDLVGYLLKGTSLKQSDLQGIADLIKGARLETGKEFAALRELIALVIADDGMPEGFNFARLMQDIDELMVDSGDKAQILARIKAAVETVQHEAKLVAYLRTGEGDTDTITARLLEARTVLQAQPSQATDSQAAMLRASTEKVLDLANAVKLLNLPLDANGRDFFYLPLPVRVGEHVTTAEIKIYAKGTREQRAQKETAAYTVGFALDMPSLGATRALVEVADSYINVGIAIENSKALDMIDVMFEELTTSLEELGYTVGRLSAAQLKPEPARSLIEEKLGVTQDGIDVKA